MTRNPVDVACDRLGITNAELARRLDVSPGRVSQWKARGRISAGHVMKLVEMTGVPANVFNSFFPPYISPRKSDSRKVEAQ